MGARIVDYKPLLLMELGAIIAVRIRKNRSDGSCKCYDINVRLLTGNQNSELQLSWSCKVHTHTAEVGMSDGHQSLWDPT